MAYMYVDIDVGDLDDEIVIEYLLEATDSELKYIMLRADLHNRFIGIGDLGELLHRLETFGLVDMLKLLAEKARLVDGEYIVLNAIKELESERA